MVAASLGRYDRTNREGGGRMLALTDNAVEAVQEILSSSEVMPETGGLRLAADPAGAQTNFQLSVVALPAEDDEVIEEQGARVFLALSPVASPPANLLGPSGALVLIRSSLP